MWKTWCVLQMATAVLAMGLVAHAQEDRGNDPPPWPTPTHNGGFSKEALSRDMEEAIQKKQRQDLMFKLLPLPGIIGVGCGLYALVVICMVGHDVACGVTQPDPRSPGIRHRDQPWLFWKITLAELFRSVPGGLVSVGCFTLMYWMVIA